MGSKKNKGKGASSSSHQAAELDYDTNRCPFGWACKRFFRTIATRVLIPEWRLAPNPQLYSFVVSEIL